MTDPIKIRVRGVPEFEAGAHRLFDRIDLEAQSEFLDVADRVANATAGRVPVITGKLAGSYSGERASHGASVESGLVYAGPVDYGGWPPGRPFIPTGRYLYPTALATVDELQRAGEKGANDAIGSMSWPTPL